MNALGNQISLAPLVSLSSITYIPEYCRAMSFLISPGNHWFARRPQHFNTPGLIDPKCYPLNNFYINLARGQNVASDMGMFVEVGVEQIIAWDPEVILLNGFEAKLSPHDVYNNELLADVSAVKNRRVYKMPLGGYRWDPPNQESPLN